MRDTYMPEVISNHQRAATLGWLRKELVAWLDLPGSTSPGPLCRALRQAADAVILRIYQYEETSLTLLYQLVDELAAAITAHGDRDHAMRFRAHLWRCLDRVLPDRSHVHTGRGGRRMYRQRQRMSA